MNTSMNITSNDDPQNTSINSSSIANSQTVSTRVPSSLPRLPHKPPQKPSQLPYLLQSNAIQEEPYLFNFSRKYSIQRNKTKNKLLIGPRIILKPKPLPFQTRSLQISNSKFLARTKEISKMKYIIKLKSNFHNSQIKHRNDEISTINRTIQYITSMKTKLNDNYISNVIVSINKLCDVIDKEYNVLNNICIKESELQNDVQKISIEVQRVYKEKQNHEKWLSLIFYAKYHNNVIDIPKEINLIQKGISTFPTVDEFNDSFEQSRKHTLNKLNYYNELQYEIDLLKQEYNDMINDNITSINKYNTIITDKQNLLQLLIKQNNKLRLIKQQTLNEHKISFESLRPKKKLILSSLNPLAKSNNYLKVIYNTNDKELMYVMLYNMYKRCVECLGEKLPGIVVNLNDIDKKELRMLPMMTGIEVCYCYLKDKLKMYFERYDVYGKDIESALSKLEYLKKVQRSEVAKKMENKRYAELKRKIEEKKNKVYYVPKKKMNLYPYGRLIKGKEKDDIRKSEEEGMVMFEDLMYDEKED